MDFNDPALEHLVNKITIALQENNREEAARYMDIIIEEYPEVANILMNSIEFQTLMAENEEIAEKAFELMEKEAEKGNGFAMHDLGKMHLLGHGCEKDEEVAQVVCKNISCLYRGRTQGT